MECLYNHGNDTHNRSQGSDLLVHACTIENNAETIQFLLEKGYNVNDLNFVYENSLHAASKVKKNCQVLEFLLNFGGDLSVVGWVQETPLEVAILISKNFESVKFLFEKGLERNLDYDLLSMLHRALCAKKTAEMLYNF